MTKKGKKNEQKSGFSWIYVVLILLAIGTFAFVKGRRADSGSRNSPADSAPEILQKEQSFPMPPYLENPDAADLAATLDPATVSPHARNGYDVARQKPKLLAQLPCFCYCEGFGHGSLHDCFVSDHAEGCDICLKEALEAHELEDRGAAPAEIRKHIVDKYHPRESAH